MGPRRGSWDWSSRRGEDERERDDPWRNGGGLDDDWSNGRSVDRRKAYQKPSDHVSSRSTDERGGAGGNEGMRNNRDWHPRGSPQGFNTYRNMEDDFYGKEPIFKSDKLPRPPYQRHEPKAKRRDNADYHSRSRHLEIELAEGGLHRRHEDRRHSSPGRGRSKNTSRRHTSAEKHGRRNATEKNVSNLCKCTLSLW